MNEWFTGFFVMILRNHRVALNFTRAFNYPIFFFFVFKAAIVANKFLKVTVFIFSSGNTQNFIAFFPKHHFTTAFRTIAVCIEWLGKPNAAFKPECSVG